MRPFTSVVTTIFTGALAFLLLGFGLPASPSSAFQSAQIAPPTPDETACDASRSVQVSGTAVVNVTPDQALIQLGVQSNGSTTQAVEAMNSAATQSVIKAVMALGVEGKDIATDRYVIEPIYENYDSLYIKGYRINNVVAITLREVNKTSQVIAAALRAGANQVINVDFYTSQLRQYRDQAREMAMQAAREKATALAKAAGAGAGCVLTITENSWSYYNGWWYGRGQSQSIWTQNVMQNIPSGAGNTAGEEPISLGQISIKAEIAASFGLE